MTPEQAMKMDRDQGFYVVPKAGGFGVYGMVTNFRYSFHTDRGDAETCALRRTEKAGPPLVYG